MGRCQQRSSPSATPSPSASSHQPSLFSYLTSPKSLLGGMFQPAMISSDHSHCNSAIVQITTHAPEAVMLVIAQQYFHHCTPSHPQHPKWTSSESCHSLPSKTRRYAPYDFLGCFSRCYSLSARPALAQRPSAIKRAIFKNGSWNAMFLAQLGILSSFMLSCAVSVAFWS